VLRRTIGKRKPGNKCENPNILTFAKPSKCCKRGLEISNNAAENAIRPLTLGRKNWLFAGSDSGGERAAVFYTLIRTAKLNGLEPEAYLREVLTRIGEHPINAIDALLPWNIAKPATLSVAA
jgi:hypothetical protein